jgi:hypothetical protein
MNDERKQEKFTRNNDEREQKEKAAAVSLYSSFIVHDSSFILPPSSFIL